MEKDKDPNDWWKKPEHLNNDSKSRRSKSTPSKSRKTKRSERVTKVGFWMRIIKHGLIIGLVVAVGAVATHFGMRVITRHGAHCTVPQFQTLTMSAAERLAESHDLKLIVNDSLYATAFAPGEVLDQLPEAGTVVKPGRTVYLTINATQQKMVDMPYVAGRSLRQAKNMLEVAGLAIERLIYEEDLATNYILEQRYADRSVEVKSDMKVPIGSGVTLVVGVGEGEGDTSVPSLVGSSLHLAKSLLLDACLNVGTITMDQGIDHSNIKLAQVMTQSLDGESVAQLGDVVDITLTLSTYKVDSVLMAIQSARLLEEQELELEEQMRLYDEAIADSLSLVGMDPQRATTSKPKVERVVIEDLFN